MTGMSVNQNSVEVMKQTYRYTCTYTQVCTCAHTYVCTELTTIIKYVVTYLDLKKE